jgi:hypothetical protein
MARELGTRGTLDIDLYREISLAAAETDLRHAAAADIDDWFRFEVGAAIPLGTVGVRLPVTSVIGTTTWASFHVDLIGSGLRMTGHPEHVPPLAENAIPEVDQHGYQAYPLVDHVADECDHLNWPRFGLFSSRIVGSGIWPQFRESPGCVQLRAVSSTRLRSSGSPALPNIWRLIILKVTWNPPG